MNFLKRYICWGAAILFLTVRLDLAQTTPAQSPSATPEKLDSDNVGNMNLDTRRQMLSALTPEARDKLAEQFLNLPPGGLSNGKINAFFMAWSVVDLAKAIETAKKLPTVDMRRAAVEATCFGMKPEGAKMVAHAIREFRGDVLAPADKERLLAMAMAKWSQVDPASAAQFLAEVYPNAATRLAKPGAGDGDLLTTTRAIGENWGAAAPQAALDWFQKKQQPENLVAVQGVIIGWWRKDQKAAAAYLSTHNSTPNEREVAGVLSGAMAERDPGVAVQWVEWINEEKLRRRMRLGIAELWATRDPKAAGAWSKSQLGKEGEDAIAVVAGVWAFKDASAAQKWIDSLHGRARDVAIRGYVRIVAPKKPESALNCIVKMEDHQARQRLAKAVIADWIKQNLNDAKAWIKKSKLSQAEKKELLEVTSIDAH